MLQGWSDFEKGVEVKPSFGNQVNITYNGLLPRSGAEEVYVHCGYGDPNSWRDTQTLRMERTASGFEKTIPMRNHTAAFCFKDNAHNWDNNSGYNWLIRE